MSIWIILIVITVLAFIFGWNHPSQDEKNDYSKESHIEPIFDDGEIVGWYEEEE